MPRELIVSPRGEAQWAKVLGEPAEGFDEGSPRAWSVSLLLDPSDPETIAFVERVEAVFLEFHGPKAKVAANGWPFGDETTKDDKGRPVPTGKIRFNFKRKQELPRGGMKAAPVVVDSRKNLWPTDKLIGNGSKIKVAFSPWKWEGPSGKGMSLELESIQVLDLVSYDPEGTTDLFGEEDGYVLDTPEAQLPFQQEEPTGFAAQLRARAAEVQAAAVNCEIPF